MARSKKIAAGKTDTLGAVLRARIEEFSDPDKYAQLWQRTRAELAGALDGGVKIGEALGKAILDSGLHPHEGVNAAIKRRTSDLQKLRNAMINGTLDAGRFAIAWKQVNETAATRFAAVKEKTARKTIQEWDNAVNSAVELIFSLPAKILKLQ